MRTSNCFHVNLLTIIIVHKRLSTFNDGKFIFDSKKIIIKKNQLLTHLFPFRFVKGRHFQRIFCPEAAKVEEL